jgi:hypothetical protein
LPVPAGIIRQPPFSHLQRATDASLKNAPGFPIVPETAASFFLLFNKNSIA